MAATHTSATIEEKRPRRFRTAACCSLPSIIRIRRSVAELLVDRHYLRAVSEERIDARRIEVLAALRFQKVDAFIEVPRVLVRPLAHERVEHICHRDDTRDERNVIAVQAVR